MNVNSVLLFITMRAAILHILRVRSIRQILPVVQLKKQRKLQPNQRLKNLVLK